MIYEIVFFSIRIFLSLLQIVLIMKIILDLFSVALLKKIFNFLCDPILQPIRGLLKYSVFFTAVSDLSPIVGFIIISYLQQLLLLT